MDDKRDRTLWCGNLDPRVTECLLYELFIQAGPLEEVTIPKDNGGRLRSYGFVTFEHPESVGYTLALMEGVTLYGRQLKLERRPDAAVDDTYIIMMANHVRHVDAIKRQRFQEMPNLVQSHFMSQRFQEMPNPMQSHFISQRLNHPPRSLYDRSFYLQTPPGRPVPAGKYNNREYHSGHRHLPLPLPLPLPYAQHHRSSTHIPGHPAQRYDSARRHEDHRHYDNSHRRRHTHDPYWRGYR